VPEVEWGGRGSSGGYTAGVVYSDGIPLPTGRMMASGSQACIIVALWGWVGGNGAARSINMALGNSGTGQFDVGNHASDAGTGWIGSGGWLVQGGTTRFQINNAPSGPLWIGRGGGGTTFGPSWSRAGTLGGLYRYVQSPSEPTSYSLTGIGPTNIVHNFGFNGDQGETGITAYRVQCADNPSFSGPREIDTGSGTNNFTGLKPGTTYYFRVAARNWVTDAAGTVGPWSSVMSAKTLSGAYVNNGSAFGPAQMFVGDGGTAWKDTSVFVADGTNWNPAQ